MFHGGGPLVVLGFAGEPVDVVLVVDEDPTLRRVLPGLVVPAVTSCKALAINPIAAMEP